MDQVDILHSWRCYQETIDELPLICFAPALPHFSSFIYQFLLFPYLTSFLLAVLFYTVRCEAGALLAYLARNLLFLVPCTEAKRITSSRQMRAMHNSPFSGAYLGINGCFTVQITLFHKNILLSLDTRMF